MYVEKSHSGKYVHYLLRDSFRPDGKVKHRTIADLSSYSSAEIHSIQIVQELARWWQDLDATVPEGIEELKTLCTMELRIQGHPKCNCIPQPRASVQRFLEKAKVVLPADIRHRGIKAATRKKLLSRCKTH
jgi:hypothetical protein